MSNKDWDRKNNSRLLCLLAVHHDLEYVQLMSRHLRKDIAEIKSGGRSK